MKRDGPIGISLYWLTAALTLGVAAGLTIFYTPTEATMGAMQKVFYIHLPSAINTFLACAVVFVGSIGYLSTRKDWWDDLAAAAAKAAVVFCSVVLITGMFWAKYAWGTWWTWSPRLTFSLMLWLLYVVYLINRSSIDSGRRRAVVSAVYGVVAFLDVPLVYLSARLLPDIHPTSMSMDVRMKLTLAFWFVPVTLVNAGFVAAGYAIERRWRSRLRARDVEGPRPMKLELLRGGLA
jgi:heme exporter protein C